MSKITLDYDDIVGGSYLWIKDVGAVFGVYDYNFAKDAVNAVKMLFDYIGQWQESGMTLESLENDTSN